MTSIPTGTVTFLFTDMVVSTPLWERHPEAMGQVVQRHDALVREIVEAHGGYLFKTVGDEACVAFSNPAAAITAAVAIQQSVAAENWGEVGEIQVRMGLHTGAAEQRDGDYFGLTLSRVARVRSLAHGRQILVSSVTRQLCDLPPDAALGFRDLGAHRLRGVNEPQHIFQVLHPTLPADFPPLPTSEGPPTNLPSSLSTFVGRERELEEVERLLLNHRLVTLTGPGGSGKTRLAVETGRRLAFHYPAGAWLIDLAPLSTPESVAQAAVSALGLHEQPGGSLSSTLIDHLRNRQVLLIIDNCEHLLDAAARLADALLRACPGVRILATGRESLGITGEHAWPVPPLSVPVGPGVSGAADIEGFEAVQLFVDRATEVDAHFALTDENAAAVAGICVSLDGVPLAIELAARRLRVLSPAQVAARMQSQLELLTSGERTASPRQQTLRAAIDWSYEPLAPEAKRLLRRLSVFAGGWSLDAATAVCGDGSSPVFDGLATLVDRSLVIKEESAGEVRYRFLEMIRQYGRAHLEEAGELADARARHRGWCQQLADEADPHLRTRDMPTWLGRLQQEQDNLREAITSAAPGSEEAVDALRLAASLGRFWSVAGYWTEGRRLLEGALAGAPDAPPALRARACYALATLAFSQGDHPAATANLDLALSLLPPSETLAAADALNLRGMIAQRSGDHPRAVASLEEAVGHYRAAGDRQRLNAGLNNLGLAVESSGDLARATALYEESLAIKRELGDELGVAGSLHNLGAIALHLGQPDRAAALQREALAIGRRTGSRRLVTSALIELGKVLRHTGDPAGAAPLYTEALGQLAESGDQLGVAEAIEGLAFVALALGVHDRAATLLGAARAIREDITAPASGDAAAQRERAADELISAMGAQAYEAAHQGGLALRLTEAVELALRPVSGGATG